MFLFDKFLYFNMKLNFSKLFFTNVITLASPQKIFYGYFKSQSFTTVNST